MELWNKVCKTNPAHTKKVKFGRAITAIDPYRQIENATREFGAAGQGWGWEVKKVHEIECTKQIGVLVRVWIKDQEHFIEQWGQAGMYIDNNNSKKDEDCFKKATTDGVTKCLSYMGFNADIFLGKFDDNKYVAQMTQEFAPKAKVATKEEIEQAITALSLSQSKDDLKDAYMALEKHVRNHKSVVTKKDELKQVLS